jgi:hypothetical protein
MTEENKEIKAYIAFRVLEQIIELKKHIESDRIRVNENIVLWYLKSNYDEGMQALTKLFEYFFIHGNRYLTVYADEEKRLVFEFHDQSQFYKKHFIIFEKDKLIYKEITTGMGKVLDWEVHFIPVIIAKNKVLEKAPAGVF